METKLSPDLMRAIVLATGFRGNDMDRAQAAMLMIGLRGIDWDAGVLSGEICNGDQHICGMACASLAAQGLIKCVGRVKSSNPLRNGAKINLWRIPANKVNTVKTWLARHNYPHNEEMQQSLAI